MSKKILVRKKEDIEEENIQYDDDYEDDYEENEEEDNYSSIEAKPKNKPKRVSKKPFVLTEKRKESLERV